MRPVPLRIEVAGPLAHSIRIGRGLLFDPSQWLDGSDVSAWALVGDERVLRRHGDRLERAVRGLIGPPVCRIPVAAGERSKTWESAGSCLERIAEAGLDRDGVILALGGGATLDLAGFVASVYRRGVRHVALPTTLLAQVDAAVGGKTAVDGLRAKNLFGTFHPPSVVVSDPDVLATLPPEERRSGLGEVLKCALLEGGELLARLESAPEELERAPVPEELLAGCVRLKARLVEADPFDRGARRLLNLGHTIGHALEAAAGFHRIRHGEAVAWGLIAETRLAERIGLAEEGLSRRIGRLSRALGLCREAPRVRAEAVWEALRHDKKWSGGRRTFILLERPGRARAAHVEDEGALREAVERLASI